MSLFPKPGSLDFYLNACIKEVQNNSHNQPTEKERVWRGVHCQEQGNFLEVLQRRLDNTDNLNQGGSHGEKKMKEIKQDPVN